MSVVFQETFTGFTGAGFGATPTAGQLDSDIWLVNGMSDNVNPAFGFSSASGDFARGVITTANPTTGGVYATAAGSNVGSALVLQPGGADVDPGSITARIVNTTGAALNNLTASFDWITRNNETRADQLTFSYSTDGVHFTAVPTATFTTPAAGTDTTFTNTPEHDITLGGITVGADTAIYLRWSHSSTGAGSRDEVGIDNVTLSGDTEAVDNTPPTLVGSTPAEHGIVAADTNLTLQFSETVKAGVGSFTITGDAGDMHTISAGDTSQVSFSGATVTINPTGNLNIAEGYHLSVSADALTDTAGNAYAGTGANPVDFETYNPNPKIYEIQGAGHTSPLVGLQVTTTGVVTAIDTTGSKGFWIQDATGDGNDATSDAVFVFSNSDVTSKVHVGDLVQVAGKVTEFAGADPNNLSTTEVDTNSNLSQVTVIGTGHIDATIIGAGGHLPPTEVIDNDHFGTFDPAQDGVDFYESMEGMLVTVTNSQATDATFFNSAGAGSTWIVADNGAEATGLDSRGSVTIGPNDLNPERIQIFADSGVSNLNPGYVVGDHPGNVTGVISYFGGDYELLPTAIQNTTSAGVASVPRETTTLGGDANHVTIASYNLENLDPTDPQLKFDSLGGDIAHNLGGPDIIGVEEIQDADGAGNGGNLSGTATLDKLVAAISAAGGPHYSYVEIDPTVNNQTGGEPNGNIRQAFLYNADRVQFVNGSLHNITDDDPTNGDAFGNSRMPLTADFTFNGQTVTVIDVHNLSRGGSDEPFGLDQPPINAGDVRRVDQTAPVERFVQHLEATDPNAHVSVMGDFNAFPFETTLTQLTTGGILQNLADLLPANEAFSYIFEGNAQEIDNMLVSPTLQAGAQFDIVHLNTGLPDAARPTDHDPIVSRLFVDTKPVAVGDAAATADNQSVNIDVLANDTDADAGDTKTLVSVSATTLGGHASIVGGQVVYVADADSFDQLTTAQHVVDTFTYVQKDAQGLTSTATVAVTVSGSPAGPTQTGDAGDNSLTGTNQNEKLDGGAGNDTIDGGSGADTVAGGLGNDLMIGGAGSDSLSASDGADTLAGGGGNDVLSGNRGNDLFAFGTGFGHDTILDYQAGADHIAFQGVSGFASFSDVAAHMVQSGINVIITDAAGDTLQINSTTIATLTSHSGDFLFA
jgi:predicted extracellular nuclease